MKQTYVYFGKRGYYKEAIGTDEASSTLTNANSGMLPTNQSVDGADLTHSVRDYVQTVTAATGGRGTAYGTTDHNGITMVSANPAVRDVVRIIDTAFIKKLKEKHPEYKIDLFTYFDNAEIFFSASYLETVIPVPKNYNHINISDSLKNKYDKHIYIAGLLGWAFFTTQKTLFQQR